MPRRPTCSKSRRRSPAAWSKHSASALRAGEGRRFAERATRQGAYDGPSRGGGVEQPQHCEPTAPHPPISSAPVASDPSFVRAWARLAQTEAILIRNFPAEALRGRLRPAPRQAGSRTGTPPRRPMPRTLMSALDCCFGLVECDDARALARFARGLRSAPNSVKLVRWERRSQSTSLAGGTRRWGPSSGRSGSTLGRPNRCGLRGRTLLWLRRYAEAREALERAQRCCRIAEAF